MIKESKIKFIYCLLLTLLWGCTNNAPERESIKVVTFNVKGNDLKLEVDSILKPSETLLFPIRLKLTNNTNKKIVLLFGSIKSKDESSNLYLLSSKGDTTKFKNLGSHIIFDEHSATSFTVAAKCNINEFTVNFKLFERRFCRGSKIVYSYNKKLPELNKQDFKYVYNNIDTLKAIS